MYPRVSSAAALAAIMLILAPCAARAGDQDTSNGSVVLLAQAEGPMVITPQPNPNGPHATSPNSLPPPSGESGYDAGGPGTPYEPAPGSCASGAWPSYEADAFLHRSGNNADRPDREAWHTPRSVMRPVTIISCVPSR